MKRIKKQSKIKQIVCIILIIMLCNFIIPNISYAETDSGTIFAPISKFTVFLCDTLMQFMQDTFITKDKIKQGNSYNFQYSPAIIFSGTVPAFDINFISPNTKEDFGVEDWLKENRKTFSSQAEPYEWEEYEKLPAGGLTGCSRIEEKIDGVADYYTYYKVENDRLYVYHFAELYANSTEPVVFCYYENSYEMNDTFLEETNTTRYGSIAYVLQDTVATWYNALRKIALVGLLSVLVYIGIQIILTSASGQENSKYKKMLVDWLVALCLLFTLHYIMNAILIITQKLSSVLNNGTTDTLLNTLRAEIEKGKTWEEVVSQTIMYAVLVILTIMFTFQYFKRVLYMAFFTIIAPLVTLTYPLDKIKDSKAQAFTMWIREFVFNALIQIVHLVVYYTLVGSALGLVDVFPLYGIIAIAFISQGEKIIRKMFGFNNADTVGTMQAAAMGGLASAALKKLTKSAKPHKKMENPNKGIRTASGNGALGGAKAIGSKYGKEAGSALIGTLAGIQGGMIGLASGITQGDLTAALTGAVAGKAAGKGIGQGLVNGLNADGIQNAIENLEDTYNEGAYGKETAEAMKRNKAFRNSSTYKELKKNPKFSEESVQAMLDADITDKDTMNKILDSGLDVDDAIKYNTIAEHCPPEILYDDEMFKTFCNDIRKMDDTFANINDEQIGDNVKLFV